MIKSATYVELWLMVRFGETCACTSANANVCFETLNGIRHILHKKKNRKIKVKKGRKNEWKKGREEKNK